MQIPEYVSDFKLSSKVLRSFAGLDVAILKVYPPYRYMWDDGSKKFRSAYAFPFRLKDEVVYSGDERAKKQEGDTFEFREKFWDDGEKKFGFRKIRNDGVFYKSFKKVCDVDVVVNGEIATQVWDGKLKQNVEVILNKSTVATISAFPMSKLIPILEVFDLDSDVEMVDGKDKAGNPAKVRPFNWEDAKVSKLGGKVFTFKVRGEGMDTKYTFKEGKDFELVEATPTPTQLDPDDIF